MLADVEKFLVRNESSSPYKESFIQFWRTDTLKFHDILSVL